MRGLIDISELTIEEIESLMDTAEDIIANPWKYAECCKGKKLATLFFEPSTRTRLSFEAAMHELGGSVIGFSDGDNSSAVKGESVADTARVVGCYADIIAMRHFIEGAPFVADRNCVVPVINAGDGGHNHPTQTLADLLTIRREKGEFSHLTVGFCGDLKYGRTVHSLIDTMSHFEGNKFVLISTPELGVPDYTKEILEKQGCEYVEVTSLQEAMPELDVLYMTRIQRERFASIEEYNAQKGVFVLDRERLELGKKDLKVLHPLPRVDEITEDIDNDPRCVYFKQTVYGMYARMALILLTLEGSKYSYSRGRLITDNSGCVNPKCITHTEPYMPKEFKQNGDYLICEYCDTKKPYQK